jgi:hypothetical protein
MQDELIVFPETSWVEQEGDAFTSREFALWKC